LNAGGFVEGEEIEVGRRVTGAKVAGAGAHPHGFEGSDEENGRDGHAHHHAAKRLGRLLHCPEDVTGEYDPDEEEGGNHAHERTAEPGFFRSVHPHEWGDSTRWWGRWL